MFAFASLIQEGIYLHGFEETGISPPKMCERRSYIVQGQQGPASCSKVSHAPAIYLSPELSEPHRPRLRSGPSSGLGLPVVGSLDNSKTRPVRPTGPGTDKAFPWDSGLSGPRNSSNRQKHGRKTTTFSRVSAGQQSACPSDACQSPWCRPAHVCCVFLGQPGVREMRKDGREGRRDRERSVALDAPASTRPPFPLSPWGSSSSMSPPQDRPSAEVALPGAFPSSGLSSVPDLGVGTVSICFLFAPEPGGPGAHPP